MIVLDRMPHTRKADSENTKNWFLEMNNNIGYYIQDESFPYSDDDPHPVPNFYRFY